MIPALVAGGLAASAVALAALTNSAAERAQLIARTGWRPTKRAGRVPKLPSSLIWIAGAAVAWLVGGAIAGTVGSLAAVAILLCAPLVARRRRDARRAAAVAEQLADAIAVIATGLRSGRSLVQAIELAAAEIDPPLGPSFRRLADRSALGDPVDDTLRAWALDVSGPDARLAAGVLRLHRRTGGALAAALDDLASTLRARRSAARELHSLTAQARLSATILGLLPIGFFVFLSVVAGQDLHAAYRTPVGTTAILLGFSLQICAYIWIRRILRTSP